ncbi:MAG: response regulator [FCB group bacterium]|nr:response regulator [FCB group bacterium]
MTIELAASIVYFALTVFALLFSVAKSSRVEGESFPNRGRYFVGLILWVLASILAVFTSFPGYGDWFLPQIYPILKIVFVLLFLTGFFMLLTTAMAFPIHLNHYRREINGRSGRIALLENIRQISSQPYPVTELFALVLRELASFLVISKGAVFLTNPSKREMYLVSHIGLDKHELSRLERFPLGQDIISRAAGEQAPFVSGDLATSDPSSRKLLLAGRDITMSAAAVPLVIRDHALGALLVLADKPFRFEKPDRMLLGAAAEALAGVVETNRLTRENQKLSRRLDNSADRLQNLQSFLNLTAGAESTDQALLAVCKYIAERQQATACRIVRLIDGELEDEVRFEIAPDTAGQSESYIVAVIDAIRRRKMVILNQESRIAAGGTEITRSTLLCPLELQTPGEYALLVEAPGNGLRLTESFIAEIETMIGLAAVNLTLAGLKETDELNQSAVGALLNILKINQSDPTTVMFERFVEEAGKIGGDKTTVLVFVSDEQKGFRLLDNAGGEDETIILPGEGPIGRAAATGDVQECTGRAQLEKSWQNMEPVNQDLFGRLFGEKGLPDYHLLVPVKILDEAVGVMTVFSHAAEAATLRREKGILLLAAQLLSIKLSMARMAEDQYQDLPDGAWQNAGHIFNQINNDLATVIGRAQLMSRQTDLPGRTRYTTEEISRAAESAAESIKLLQSGVNPPVDGNEGLVPKVDIFLKRRHVTGNLYMFDDNTPVRLQKELTSPEPEIVEGDKLSRFIEAVLERFVHLLDEGDEVFLKSETIDQRFYISLVRGSRDKQRQFNPADFDFGAPDVLPRDIVGEELISVLIENKGEVSFDRFGRQPTYLSFRFPPTETTEKKNAVKATKNGMAGLRILAIDDQQMILDLLSGICQSLDLELTAELDPIAGMEKFRRENFDIVMVDLAMGEVSGWDVAREVKHYSPDTPVIMITGWGMDLDPENIRRAGVDFTLAKPFKIEQLTEVIRLARKKHLLS